MKKTLFLLISFSLLLTQCQKKEHTWLLEQLGGNEFAISRSYLENFDKLKTKDKIKLYYLTRAAIAGRDIFYDQRYKDALKIRNFFEQLVEQNKLSSPLKEKVIDYLKYIWINNSQYHARTGLKLIPQFTYDELKGAIPKTNIAWLKDPVFNAKYKPILTNLTPKKEDGDIIQASATNIYSDNMNLLDVEKLDAYWQTKLNVRFEKVDERVVPQPYKIGGLYGKELENVAFFLRKAAALSEGKQKEGLENLIEFYKTGDEETFKKASIDWLQSEPVVDTINGFIESYMDPRQTVGSWEGTSYITKQDPLLEAFTSNVKYFEEQMPWKDEYKRTNFSQKPVANLINVATAIGFSGPVTWSGVNLPNYQDIRSQYGSKNSVLANMIEARNQVSKDLVINEFYLPEYKDLMKKYHEKSFNLLVYMHEVIGHASGKAADNIKSDPREYIGQNYGAWEEARASLVAWHYITDPKLIDMGAFTKDEQNDVIKAFYLNELTHQLIVLKNAEHEDVLREAHDRADQMIFEYVRTNSNGFDVIQKDGKCYIQIKDINAIHKSASELLKIVHEAKATGDKKTADGFLEKYGNKFNKDWRDDVIARAKQIKLPHFVAMVFPKMVPVFKGKEIQDIKLDNSESFYDQQMRFGRISKTTEVSEKVF